ncbi:MAG: uridine phosphorylase, partial [Candidatus Thorarchaeota archaeon]
MSEKRVSAERPETSDRKQYHLEVKEGDVASTVIIPGDPQRVEKMSSLRDRTRLVASHRQFVIHTGKYKG